MSDGRIRVAAASRYDDIGGAGDSTMLRHLTSHSGCVRVDLDGNPEVVILSDSMNDEILEMAYDSGAPIVMSYNSAGAPGTKTAIDGDPWPETLFKLPNWSGVLWCATEVWRHRPGWEDNVRTCVKTPLPYVLHEWEKSFEREPGYGVVYTSRVNAGKGAALLAGAAPGARLTRFCGRKQVGRTETFTAGLVRAAMERGWYAVTPALRSTADIPRDLGEAYLQGPGGRQVEYIDGYDSRNDLQYEVALAGFATHVNLTREDYASGDYLEYVTLEAMDRGLRCVIPSHADPNFKHWKVARVERPRANFGVVKSFKDARWHMELMDAIFRAEALSDDDVQTNREIIEHRCNPRFILDSILRFV